MDPRLLLIQQVKADAEQIEQYLQVAYDDTQYTVEQRSVAIGYLYAQTRQIEDLVKSLFMQYRNIIL